MLKRRPFPIALFVVILGGWAPLYGQGGAPSRVYGVAGAGYLTSGDYFTGPASTSLANSDAAAVMLQVGVRVHRSFDLVLAGAHAQPKWRLDGLPLVGAVSLPGARLWFADAALRGHWPLSEGVRPVSVFAQVGAGVAHYSVATTLLGNRLDADATNFAVALGAGVQAPLTGRVGVELLAKDYIASFTSVRDLAAFGIEGRRAHTLVLAAGIRLDL
jgi:opacity protein-like surface antigen